MPRRLALLLTLFTGITGLVYEIAWQKYLATLLGSHSEATAAVLGIFLAGMSAGYALFGRVSRRLVETGAAESARARLLRVYGLVEIGIGVYAYAFPLYFDLVQSLAGGLPPGATGIGFALDVLVAAALIGPPTLLMGATVPMLTQALSRDLEDSTRLHARVYALNTLGATVGALAAGFLLVPVLGLARVMLAMGTLNLLAGASFVWLARRDAGRSAPLEAGVGGRRSREADVYAAVALLVGFAMMAIQTILNRLGALSFGASDFTFATVVAVNVLCIALGSLAVSRLRRVPRQALLWNQWLLFASLVALYGVLDQAPYWIHRLRTAFGSSDADFYAYYLSGFGLTLLVVGVPILFSGATLPLIFHQLRQRTGDLGALAGKIYSWNTVGSLAGALLGGYALLFWLDLHQVYRIAVAALGAAALLVSWQLGAITGSRVAVAAVALAALSALPPWSERLLASGLFRLREPNEFTSAGPAAAEAAGFLGRGGELVFYDDDPILSAAVLEQTGARRERSILNNGKSDGSTSNDYGTPALLALVPVLLTERPQQAFVIGFGTGITAGELTRVESIERVRVAEISPGVIDAAPFFDFANFGVSQNPAVEILRSDAYRALRRSRERYDLIVSEPSNPWLTGVEMLYSVEFLRAARERLTPDGVFVQWLQTYEIDDATIELVLRSYAAAFERVAIWFGLGVDMLLIGFNDGHPGYDLASVEQRASQPAMREALARSGIRTFEALLLHELMPPGVLHALALEGPLHTLHHPRLADRAARAFFRNDRGELPFIGFGQPARLAEAGSLLRQRLGALGRPLHEDELGHLSAEACSQRRDLCTAMLASWYRARPASRGLERVVALAQGPGAVFDGAPGANPFRELSQLLAGEPPPRYVDPARLTSLWRTFYQPHFAFDPAALRRAWADCAPPLRSAEQCRRGRERAEALLERGVGRPAPSPETPRAGR